MSGKNVSIRENSCPLCGRRGGNVESVREDFVLLRCPECTLVHTWPLTASRTLYDDAYTDDGEYHYYFSIAVKAQMGKLRVPWPMRRFLKSVKPGGKLLDIGCSTGRFLLAAKRRGWDVSGVEVSKKAATIARDISGARVGVGSVGDLRMGESFDAVTAWEVLEHVPDPVSFVTTAVSLLRRGGVLGLSVPNWDSPWMRQSRNPEHWPPYHLTFWNHKTLGRLFDQVGLDNALIKEKPFAWGEEVGQMKWIYLPISLARSILLHQKGMHLFAIVWKP